MAVGAGSVWVADSGDGTVTRIDPRTDKVHATITVGASPQAITVANGRVWVTVDAHGRADRPPGRGGTLRIDSQLDPESMDPALAGLHLPSEQLLYATCAKLLNYPDKPGAAGTQPDAGGRAVATDALGRRQDLHVHDPPRLSLLAALESAGDRADVQGHDRAHPQSEDAHGARVGSADIVGAGRVHGRQDAAHLRDHRARRHADDPSRSAPDPTSRRAHEPGFCAVPSDTPVDPNGVRAIPSAGPYYVASYTPGQGVVLVRNPNYRGSRPHHFARIEVTTGVSAASRGRRQGRHRRLHDLQRPGAPSCGIASGSPLATEPAASPRARRQRYFVNPQLELDFFDLNTHRPLFSDVRLRQAVNYAIDRRALAQVGEPYARCPTTRPTTTSRQACPDIVTHTSTRSHPTSRKPERSPGGTRTAVLYTCNVPPCAQQAQIVKTDLAAIGLHVEVKTFPVLSM